MFGQNGEGVLRWPAADRMMVLCYAASDIAPAPVGSPNHGRPAPAGCASPGENFVEGSCECLPMPAHGP